MPAEMPPHQLAELIVARLCHDLAGAVGAISTGAELLAEEGGAGPMAAEALDLLGASAASMAARVRFLRAVLGPSSSGLAAQARSLADGYFDKCLTKGQWVLDWSEDGGVPLGPERAKILLALICLAQECMPRGGTVLVRPRQREMVLAQSAHLQKSEAVARLTGTALGEVGPRAVVGVYAGVFARSHGVTIGFDERQGAFVFTVEENVLK